MTKFREPPRAATLAAVLARALPDARPGAIAFAVGAMIAAAKAHKRWGETTCSYPLTDAQMKRGENRMVRLARAADDALLNACAPVGSIDGQGAIRTQDSGLWLRLSFGGDPRGPCGMLHISDMPGDGFGPGWAIYE